MSLLGHSLPEGDAVHVENCDRGLAFRDCCVTTSKMTDSYTAASLYTIKLREDQKLAFNSLFR